MARAAQARARDAVLLAYSEAGHWAFGPATGLSDGDRKYLGRVGGTAESELAARRDQWPKVLAFLDRHLGTER
jgi:dienelactone hydrolase